MCISASPNRDALFLCPDFIGGISIRKRNNRVVVHLNDTELSKFAGVIGFQILHHGNSAGSFDVLLVFSHGGDLRFCMKKAPCLQNR